MNLTVQAFCGHGSKNCAIRDGAWRPASVSDYYAPEKQEVFALCVYVHERKGTEKAMAYVAASPCCYPKTCGLASLKKKTFSQALGACERAHISRKRC